MNVEYREGADLQVQHDLSCCQPRKINLAVRFPRNTSLMLLEKASCSTGLYLNIYLCYIKPVSSLLANTLDTGLMNARDSVRTMDNVVYTAFIVIAYRSGSIFLMQWD